MRYIPQTHSLRLHKSLVNGNYDNKENMLDFAFSSSLWNEELIRSFLSSSSTEILGCCSVCSELSCESSKLVPVISIHESDFL